jgi:hypothetical protein
MRESGAGCEAAHRRACGHARAAPLVVEAEDGMVVDLSLTELQEGGHRLSDVAWKNLLEDYQLLTCRATPREASRRAPSARQPRPPV